MMTDHKITKKIYTIILTAVLVYGAFFSVMAEIAFAEELAKDAETKIEASSDPKESAQPSSSGSSSSKGDTSDDSFAAEKKGNAVEKSSGGAGDGDGSGTNVDDSVSPGPDDQKKIEDSDQGKGGDSLPHMDGQTKGVNDNGTSGGEVIEEEPASDELGAGEGNGNNDGFADQYKETGENEPGAGNKPQAGTDQKKDTVDPYDFTDSRTYVDYKRYDEPSGAIRYKGFFHTFDKYAYGTEYVTMVVVFDVWSPHGGKFIQTMTVDIVYYSDGSYEAHLPWGLLIDKNDLVVNPKNSVRNDCPFPTCHDIYTIKSIDIVSGGLVSGTHADPDGSYYVPEYEPPTPPAATRAERGSTNKATAVSDTEGSSVSLVEPAYASEKLVNNPVEPETQIVNSVLSSYQSVADVAITDETNDSDSPINATTAMLAGVAAMFLITMALVIVPKV